MLSSSVIMMLRQSGALAVHKNNIDIESKNPSLYYCAMLCVVVNHILMNFSLCVKTVLSISVGKFSIILGDAGPMKADLLT